MEYKIVRNWIVESTILILSIYISGILLGLVMVKLYNDFNMTFIFILVFYPIFIGIISGNKMHTYSMFGFSRKQYFENVILFNATFSIELAIVNTIIMETMLRISPEVALGELSFSGSSILGKILYIFLYFSLMYSIIFLETSRKNSIINSYGIHNNKIIRSGNKADYIVSGGIKLGLFTCILMFVLYLLNMIVGYIVSSENQLLKICIYSMVLGVIACIYLIGYKKIIIKEIA